MSLCISFGMIVLNGEPFVRYNLRSLYPFAHQIIVVEGASHYAKSIATADGHSIDGTLQTLRQFQATEDPEGKVIIITAEDEGHANGFWSEKDEMSQAYAQRATGDYLWQIDVDEFYLETTMQATCNLLKQNPDISMISFPVITFWGGFEYTVDGFHEQRFLIQERGWPRLFRWGKGYTYATHRPPTVFNANGVNTRQQRWVDYQEANHLGLTMLHYAFIFPSQIEARVAYHGTIGPWSLARRQQWAQNFRRLTNPFQPASDGSVKFDISWLEKYQGNHPQAIQDLCADIQSGQIQLEQRAVTDIDHLLNSKIYVLATKILKLITPPLIQIELQTKSLGRLARKIGRGVEIVITGTLPIYGRELLAKKEFFARHYSLHALANGQHAGRARFAQLFFSWEAEEIRPRLAHHANGNWATWLPDNDLPAVEGRRETITDVNLLVIAKSFFEAKTAESGLASLKEILNQLKPGNKLLIYAPHPLAFGDWSNYCWCPQWEKLTEWARGEGVKVIEFNPGYDKNGFFYLVLGKEKNNDPITLVTTTTLKKYRTHLFYLCEQGNRTTGHSAKVLSAMAYRILEKHTTLIAEHHFLDTIDTISNLQAGDICIGHYGPWVVEAKRAGCHVVLYGPSDRFQAERTDLFHGEPFYQQLQARGNFGAQYAAADVGIFQGGARWRTEDMWTYQGLCRWIDLPVSPTIFPRTKRYFSSPGKRKFVFINLWDEEQKGAETARRIVEACPDYQFIAIAGIPIHQPNCQYYPWIGSTTLRYKYIVSQADFVVCPGRLDPQPGTVAEACSLGLIPILSYGSGYVLSFPRQLDVDNIDQCVETLKMAQAAAPDEIRAWQEASAKYIESFHRPQSFEDLLLYYLRELITTIK